MRCDAFTMPFGCCARGHLHGPGLERREAQDGLVRGLAAEVRVLEPVAGVRAREARRVRAELVDGPVPPLEAGRERAEELNRTEYTLFLLLLLDRQSRGFGAHRSSLTDGVRVAHFFSRPPSRSCAVLPGGWEGLLEREEVPLGLAHLLRVDHHVAVRVVPRPATRLNLGGVFNPGRTRKTF